MNKRLLLISTDTIHTWNYYSLVADEFSEVLLISNQRNESFPDVPVKLFDFSLRKPFEVMRKVKTLRRMITDFRPDIIHVHQANSVAFYAIRAARKLNIPIIVTAWGSDVLYVPQKVFLYRKMTEYVLRKATAFSSDSVFMADVMRKMCPSKQLDILIANFGINVDKLDIPKENIIYSNRQLKPLYRINKVIEAFHRFYQQHPEGKKWKLVIAATGTETDKLKAQVASLGIGDAVEFAGWLDKKQNSLNYAKAKIFVSVPESDATAISLLEAMAAGCLPVVSDLPANHEWIKNGENGIIVSNLESDYFSEALSIDMTKASGINAERIAADGTREANRKKFIGLYQRILG